MSIHIHVADAQPTKISTLCPTCRALCSWYRNRDMLYGFCKEHGVVDKLPLICGE